MPLNVDKISTGSLSVNGTDITGNAPYKVYTAYINMGDGVVEKLFQNTLGVPLTWSVSLGGLTANNYEPLIGQNNVFIQATSSTTGDNAYYIVSSKFSPSPWTLKIEQRDNAGVLSSAAYVMVEIRVYN